MHKGKIVATFSGKPSRSLLADKRPGTGDGGEMNMLLAGAPRRAASDHVSMPLVGLVGNETNMTFLANDNTPMEKSSCITNISYLHETSTIELTMVSTIMGDELDQFITIITKDSLLGYVTYSSCGAMCIS